MAQQNWDNWAIWSYLRIYNESIREMVAECFGTFILVTFGNGAVAQSVLSKGANGQFISINFAYGLAVTMAVLVVGKISGAHINPAVSIPMAIAGKLPYHKLPWYILGQLFGGFLSGLAVFCVYFDAIFSMGEGRLYISGDKGTAGIFATYPQDFLSVSSGIWDQVFGTGLLVMMVFAITDEKNNKIAPGVQALLLGFVVLVIGLSFGFNSGYAINPARDFGPRLFTSLVYGLGVFSEGNHWWWIPILAPIIGGLVGAFSYKILVGIQIDIPSKVNYTVMNDANIEVDEAPKPKDKAPKPRGSLPHHAVRLQL